MELKFVAAKKPEAVNVTIQRRQRLVRRLDQQIAMIKNAKDGVLPRTSWMWMDEQGTCFLHIKYGSKIIELQKGMFAIQCDDVGEAASSLETIRHLVLTGGVDGQLSQVSAGIRSRFRPNADCNKERGQPRQ